MAKQLELFSTLDESTFQIQTDLFPTSESDEIEFKSAAGGFPKDFWKTYSSFANTNGGIIVLGVREKRGRFFYDGLPEETLVKYQKEFWNGVNNRSNVSVNIMKNSDVMEYKLNGNKVLCFNVPPAERKQKPVHLTPNPFGNTYKRNYDGDYVCKDEEVRRMLADADLSFSPDSRILDGYNITDIDQASLKQYRQIFATLRPSHPWLSLDDIEFLEQLGAYRKDRRSHKEGFTVAGILMFGKFLSITDEECCPKFFPEYREILAEGEDIRWTDRIYPDGTWETNLFQFYKLVYPKLSSRLPKPFQLSKGQRLEDTPAHTALREAFVNALIHTDYSAPGSIIIQSSSNSFSFINPGTLLVTLSQFYKGGISQCRNTNLQKMFLMMGTAEKAGSGVSKILSGWNSSHWRRPYIIIDGEPDRITLEMPLFSIIPEETLSDLKEMFGDQVEMLGKDELTALAVCHIEGDITNNRLQFLVEKHKTDITKMLQDLCKNEYLVSENKGRWTAYHLNYSDKTIAQANPLISMDSSNMDSSNMDSSKDAISDNLQRLTKVDALVNMDSTAKQRRFKYDDLAKKIEEICALEYKSVAEIACEISKSEKYLKNDILPKMIATERLTKLYSDRHPNQKYITKNSITIMQMEGINKK
ncbi:putative DNA binding domain-containing protein [Kaistella sp. PBT33-4]|uniref:RNA-binding domain-containing protein n=1 Tax=Kaistella sp. PBT33-4 TaxID=3032000 RepID=UPI0023D809DF|nr:RNA-binding domain-containing protein [Kaistella sp. PBT33-4]MDF0720117.1 putative DNA binding domain-containing protein [Kaistella sp. PBT33-4]